MNNYKTNFDVKYLIVYKKFSLRQTQLMPEDWGKVAWYHYPRFRKKALKENPPSFSFLMTCIIQAVYLKDKSLIDKAVEIVKATMKETDILIFTGSALCAIGYKDEGLTKLREAVKQNPCIRTFFALSNSLQDPEDFDEKSVLCRQILKENPNDIDALRGLIFVSINQNKFEEAKKYLNQALQLSPKNYTILESHAELLFRTGDFESALKQYKRAQKLSFKFRDVRICQQIAYCYHNLGKSKETQKAAIKMFNAAKQEGYSLDSPEINGFLIKLGKDSDFLIPEKSIFQKLADIFKK
ncbi:MAG: tetratricopeptide repeat protein [Sedimentisphaerales bacterium]